MTASTLLAAPLCSSPTPFTVKPRRQAALGIGYPQFSAVWLAAALLLSGCGTRHDDRTATGTVITDSSGITIVANGTASPSAPIREVQLDSQTVSMGALGLARVADVRTLADGGIVVADNADHRLLFARSTGGNWRAVGREGSGPAEFEGIRAVYRCANDTLVVRSGLADLKVFDAGGSFVRAISAPRLRSASYGMSSDCSAVVIGSPLMGTGSSLRDSIVVSWYAVATDSLKELSRMPLETRQMINYFGESVAVSVPFAPHASIAVGPDLVYVASTDVPTVSVYNRGGKLVRIIRWVALPERITQDTRQEFEAVRQQLDERVGRGRTAQVPELSSYELPESMPVFSRLLAPEDGSLWVQKYPSNWDGFGRIFGPAFINEPPEWWVFDSTGKLLGIVRTPAQFAIHEIRDGKIIGTQADEDGMLTVKVLQFTPGPGSPTPAL